jgi:hypothetical protein
MYDLWLGPRCGAGGEGGETKKTVTAWPAGCISSPTRLFMHVHKTNEKGDVSFNPSRIEAQEEEGRNSQWSSVNCIGGVWKRFDGKIPRLSPRDPVGPIRCGGLWT